MKSCLEIIIALLTNTFQSVCILSKNVVCQCQQNCQTMLNKYCSLGINYWLKDKLLTQTEVGENWVQYWLGAYTEVNIHNKFDFNS